MHLWQKSFCDFMFFFQALSIRLAPSLCIFHSAKSDIHEIIMNPPDEWETLCQPQILVKKVIQSLYNTLDERTGRKSNYPLARVFTFSDTVWFLLILNALHFISLMTKQVIEGVGGKQYILLC